MCKWPFLHALRDPFANAFCERAANQEPVVYGQKKKIITLNTGTTVLPPTSPSGAQDLVPAMAHTGVPTGGETGEGMMHKPTDTQAGTCRPAARPKTAE